MGLKCVIFDLDGVLVDTSVFHAKAWADLVRGEGFEPPDDLEDLVKGISRMESLKIALGENASQYSEAELTELANRKNACYLEAVKTVKASDLYPGARALLDGLRAAGIKVALGSASKNARAVLDGLGITGDFDVISDGTTHTRGKPHPDVFLGAAWMAGATPSESIVVEDAPAGITAALQGGFVSVGLGDADFLEQAHIVVDSLEALSVKKLKELHTEYRIPALTGDAALPAVTVARTQEYPLSEKAPAASWDALSWVSLQSLPEDSKNVPATQIKMQYSESSLYVLIEGHAKTASGGSVSVAPGDADVVAFYLMPDPWQRIYLVCKLSPVGEDVALRVTNHMGVIEEGQPWEPAADQRIQKQVTALGASRQNDIVGQGWVMEVKIPFAALSSIAAIPPSPGEVWYGNVCRVGASNGSGAQECWSVPRAENCHDYPRFGQLRFA